MPKETATETDEVESVTTPEEAAPAPTARRTTARRSTRKPPALTEKKIREMFREELREELEHMKAADPEANAEVQSFMWKLDSTLEKADAALEKMSHHDAQQKAKQPKVGLFSIIEYIIHAVLFAAGALLMTGAAVLLAQSALETETGGVKETVMEFLILDVRHLVVPALLIASLLLLPPLLVSWWATIRTLMGYRVRDVIGMCRNGYGVLFVTVAAIFLLYYGGVRFIADIHTAAPVVVP